jgi:hypothetical protein
MDLVFFFPPLGSCYWRKADSSTDWQPFQENPANAHITVIVRSGRCWHFEFVIRRFPMLGLSKGVLLVLGLACVTPSKAGVIFVGPFPDFAGTLTVTASVTVLTGGTAVVPIPFDGTLRITIRDRLTLGVSVTVPVFVPTFLATTICGDPDVCALHVADVWAFDLNPGGTLSLTGFDPASPQITPLSQEMFIGGSGTAYPAPMVATTLANLPAALPGFDLSAFSGNPNSIVYVAQRDLPPNDFVPEPGTFILSGASVLGLLGYLWRRKLPAGPGR